MRARWLRVKISGNEGRRTGCYADEPAFNNELKLARHCAVYEPELNRVWPRNGKRREAQITLYAEQHGWRLRYYKDGFVAIFDKGEGSEEPTSSSV
jgi:hypothetical protein